MAELSRWLEEQMRNLVAAAGGAIHWGSPSKDFMKVGDSIGAGVAAGMKNSMAAAVSQAKQMMTAVQGVWTGLDQSAYMPALAATRASVDTLRSAAQTSNAYDQRSYRGGDAPVSATFIVNDAGEMKTALAWVDMQRMQRLNATMGG